MKIPAVLSSQEIDHGPSGISLRWRARAINSAHTANGATADEAIENLRHAIVEDYKTGQVTLHAGDELVHIEV